MTHEELVERVARAISGAPFPSERSREKARTALAVIRASGCAIVPMEPDDGCIYAMRVAMREARTSGVSGQTADAVFRAEYARELAAYRAMIAASPLNPKGEA